MRRTLRPLFSALVCAAFFVQSTGAADLGPALMRGAIAPPPGLMAPMGLRPGAAVPMKAPAKPAPKGESWLSSAMAVSRWVVNEGVPQMTKDLDSLSRRLDAWTAPAPAPEPEAVDLPQAAALPAPASLPGDPSRDRMLISMEGRRVIASGLAAQIASLLQYRSELAPYQARFMNPDVAGQGVSARVDYLKPFGVTKGEEGGYRITLADGYTKLLPAKEGVPAGLRREIPLYFAGDSVDVEVVVRNTSGAPMKGLRLVSVQEDYDASGAASAPITSPVETALPDLAPGASTTARWTIKLASGGRAAVNFEQTHLRVLGKDPAGGEKVLLDKSQAGIVDPPGE